MTKPWLKREQTATADYGKIVYYACFPIRTTKAEAEEDLRFLKKLLRKKDDLDAEPAGPEVGGEVQGVSGAGEDAPASDGIADSEGDGPAREADDG